MWYDANDNLTYQVLAADSRYIGDQQPDFFGGLSNTISWKGFTLDVFFNYEYGRITQDGQVNFMIENLARFNTNQETPMMAGGPPLANSPGGRRMNVNGSESKGSGAQTGSRTWFKADYIRLKNVMLSYNISGEVTRRLKISNARFYFRAPTCGRTQTGSAMTLNSLVHQPVSFHKPGTSPQVYNSRSNV